MKHSTTAAADRLCRPARVGLFGRRGAGKTTFLTMLYREATAGRLAGLRLAAADARTAGHLADRVRQLETGEALPATLGETELRFNLYHQGARHEIVLLDYQGEHVALGRHEPARDFLRECDALWLCLEAPAGADLAAAQEAEQVVEDYLAVAHGEGAHRPMALLVTKSDLGPADGHFAVTRHALATHCPDGLLIPVSSLGAAPPAAKGDTPFEPRPEGLAEALAWLADGLRRQDEARMERLWRDSPGDLRLLSRCVRAFAARYPDSTATADHRRRLRRARATRLVRRLAALAVATAALAVGVVSFDAWGAADAREYERAHPDDPAAVRASWLAHARWHPLRNVGRPRAAGEESSRLAELERAARLQARQERLAGLRREASDPDADPAGTWAALLALHEADPEVIDDAEFQSLRDGVKGRADAQAARLLEEERGRRERRAAVAFRELERAGRTAAIETQIEAADAFLRDHGDSVAAGEAQKLRLTALRRLDERDFETAADYSAREPLHFLTRRQRYAAYLERHPDGAHVSQAREAVRLVTDEWDRHDFRAVRDAFRDRPGDLKVTRALCASYLAAHPDGRFAASARELAAWAGRAEGEGEYRVTLKSGAFARKVGATVSRGPCLSVEIEVAGVRYGPSSVVARRYDPEWSYEFPRRVRWKAGDPVRITVTDHYFWKRRVSDLSSGDGDRLALRLLAGEVEVPHGRLVFESDFRVPTLPPVD